MAEVRLVIPIVNDQDPAGKVESSPNDQQNDQGTKHPILYEENREYDYSGAYHAIGDRCNDFKRAIDTVLLLCFTYLLFLGVLRPFNIYYCWALGKHWFVLYEVQDHTLKDLVFFGQEKFSIFDALLFLEGQLS